MENLKKLDPIPIFWSDLDLNQSNRLFFEFKKNMCVGPVFRLLPSIKSATRI
jgi:hypothetical protein